MKPRYTIRAVTGFTITQRRAGALPTKRKPWTTFYVLDRLNCYRVVFQGKWIDALHERVRLNREETTR